MSPVSGLVEHLVLPQSSTTGRELNSALTDLLRSARTQPLRELCDTGVALLGGWVPLAVPTTSEASQEEAESDANSDADTDTDDEAATSRQPRGTEERWPDDADRVKWPKDLQLSERIHPVARRVLVHAFSASDSGMLRSFKRSIQLSYKDDLAQAAKHFVPPPPKSRPRA